MGRLADKTCALLTLLVMLHSIVGLQLSCHRCPCSGDYHYDVELITGIDGTTLHLDISEDHLGYLPEGCPKECNEGETVSVRMPDLTSITQGSERIGDEPIASFCLPFLTRPASAVTATSAPNDKPNADRLVHIPKHSPQQLLCVLRC